MKCYEALAEAIAAEGTGVIFGVMGDGNLHLLLDLVGRHGVRFIATRHEQAAVAMADGYSRAAGGIGVCTVTHGPGLTQTATPLTAARIARSRVVVVAGDTPKAVRHHGQNIDQQSLSLATAGAFQPLRLPATLAEDVQLAFRHVRLGKGPIVLNAGTDVQRSELPAGWTYAPSTAVVAPPQKVRPDLDRVARAADGLLSGRFPLILAGRGAVEAGAREALIELAERTGALLATTLLAKGWFDGHPFNLGIAGGYASSVSEQLLAKVDYVVGFGASFSQFTTGQRKVFPQARLVQIDVDRDRIGNVTRVDDAILADALATAQALNAAVVESGRSPQSRARTPEVAAAIAADKPFQGVDFETGPDGIDPRQAALVCDAALPHDRQVVIGLGHFSGYPAIHIRVQDPRDLILPWQLGSMAMGLPVGLGAAVARPDKPTVILEGDGGLMMTLGELETAVRENIPALILVFDDGAYGAEFQIMRREGLPTDLSVMRNPDFVTVGRALGLDAYGPTSPGELSDVLARLGRVRRPTLVRIPINRNVAHSELFRALASWSRRG